jgi:hypothetical protein
MDDGTDGWMKKASGPGRPLLYVIVTKVKALSPHDTQNKYLPYNNAWK